MTALWNPLGHAQVKLIWSLAGDSEDMVVVFGVQNATSLSPDAIAGFAVVDWTANAVAGTLGNSWTFRGAEAQLGTAEGSGGDVGVSTVAVAGTASGATLPQNSAMLVHKRSLSSGRKHRGRMYLPSGYLPEGTVDNVGEIGSGLIASFQTVLDGFLTDLAGHDIPMVIFHTEELLAPDIVTSLNIDPTIATQRTRLRR